VRPAGKLRGPAGEARDGRAGGVLGSPEAPGSAAEGSSSAPATGMASARPRPLPRFNPAPAPTDTGAPSSHRGTMSKEDIRAAMRATIPAIKACYARFLQDHPQVSGRINVRFTIVDKEGIGRVSDATVEPLTRDAGVPELASPVAEACILKAIAEADFAAPVGGPVVVTYPFLLAPKPPDGSR
jgi:hypothetical protein